MSALAVLTGAALVVAPWATFTRETGGRGAHLLLPDRIVDFTGRSQPVEVLGLGAITIVVVLALLGLIASSWTSPRVRGIVWPVAGVVLVVATLVGLGRHAAVYDDARTTEVRAILENELVDPGRRTDVQGVEDLLGRFDAMTLTAVQREAQAVGVRIRRLPYEGVAPGFAAFLSIVTGIVAVVMGARGNRSVERRLVRVSDVLAVPAVAIALALAAAAVVILALQPTPIGDGVSVSGTIAYLAGRIDTLYFAYASLFAGSLSTFDGFVEAWTLATPLIFTGLAVAFGFRAGLFNIGAPGQMVLGALATMFVGVYLPGPAWVVLPTAVAAAALGGAAWGAIPGVLKAYFGANEVINTILLNFVASSLLLFVLSSSPVFSAAALRMLAVVGAASLVGVVVAAVQPLRRRFAERPRAAFASFAVVTLVVMTWAGWPRSGDGPVVVTLPFKAPGSEAKSVPLSESARMPQLPEWFGLDPATMAGATEIRLDLAVVVAAVLLVVTLLVAGRIGPSRWRTAWGWRPIVAALATAAGYGVARALPLGTIPFTVPSSNLNGAFFIAIGAAVVMQAFLWRTRFGYELRAVGLAPRAAEYAGASIPRSTVLTMAISGAFAGLTATHYVLGGALDDFSLRQALPTSDGFDGIAVALLGGNTPVGVVASAFLFGVLKNGGSSLSIHFSDLTRDVVNMILALIVLFIAAKGFLPDRFTDVTAREAFRRRSKNAGDSEERRETAAALPGTERSD